MPHAVPESRPPPPRSADASAANRKVRAIHLLSGGLDSRLAARLLVDQGIAVTGVVFESMFFDAANGRQAAADLGLPLLIEDFNDDILSLLQSPRHGFGAGLNPCIDCHIAMIRRAGSIMRDQEYDFVSTGEVLNQRPLSQTPRALRMVAGESGLGERLLRPLSAQLLPPTLPERTGLVDRRRLLRINGRSRKPQMQLAVKYGIRNYPQPAGGCLLTDPQYGRKIRDLRDHEGLLPPFIRRLRIGRHFRLTHGRLIVGRNHAENLRLEEAVLPGEALLRPAEHAGATGLLAPDHAAERPTAGAICAHFSKCPPDTPTSFTVITDSAGTTIHNILPADRATIERLLIK